MIPTKVVFFFSFSVEHSAIWGPNIAEYGQKSKPRRKVGQHSYPVLGESTRMQQGCGEGGPRANEQEGWIPERHVEERRMESTPEEKGLGWTCLLLNKKQVNH